MAVPLSSWPIALALPDSLAITNVRVCEHKVFHCLVILFVSCVEKNFKGTILSMGSSAPGRATTVMLVRSDVPTSVASFQIPF